MAARATPSRLRNGVLILEVSDPAWMFQIQHMKERLLEKLQAALGKDLEVTDLRIVLAREGA